MHPDSPVVLTDPRLPGLYRRVFHYAGVPVPPEPASDERFVVRTGPEPPDLFAKLLEEALVEDEAEVAVWRAGGAPDYHALGDGGLAVRPGFETACPDADVLRRAVGPGGAMLFAVERRDAGGRLLGVTWVAAPEGEPPPEARFRAAVLRLDDGP